MIVHFAKTELINEDCCDVKEHWESADAKRILRKQSPDGYWKYPGKTHQYRTPEDYDQIETFRQFSYLIEKHGMTKEHDAVKRAAEYLFSKQTEEGDFRGIYGNQYAHTYSPAIMELLIKAGYEKDPRIEHGFKWLLATRQDDGGWAAPVRTHAAKFQEVWDQPEPLQPVREKPFSHLMTGTVLRAFAAHPKHRHDKEAYAAGELLASRFFKSDKYADRRTPEYWERFSFPAWFTDLVSALDSLSLLGFKNDHPQIKEGLNWFVERQKKTGEWELRMVRGENHPSQKLWLSLAICRIFKRFYS